MYYALIDVTSIDGPKVLAVALLRQVTLLGKIAAAQGRRVKAPPIEGRGLSVFNKVELQYLYWNISGETPPDEFGDLIQACLEKLRAIPADTTPLEKLQYEVSRLYPEVSGAKIAPVNAFHEKEKGQGPRPKATSTTGRIWDIADNLLASGISGRKEILAACEAEGINASTAATQYAKWKASKKGV